MSDKAETITKQVRCILFPIFEIFRYAVILSNQKTFTVWLFIFTLEHKYILSKSHLLNTYSFSSISQNFVSRKQFSASFQCFTEKTNIKTQLIYFIQNWFSNCVRVPVTVYLCHCTCDRVPMSEPMSVYLCQCTCVIVPVSVYLC